MQEGYKFWLAVVSAAMWVFMRHKGKPFLERFAITGISVGFGLSLAEALHKETGRGLPISAAIIIMFIWVVLDVISSLLQDANFKERVLNKFLGKG